MSKRILDFRVTQLLLEKRGDMLTAIEEALLEQYRPEDFRQLIRETARFYLESRRSLIRGIKKTLFDAFVKTPTQGGLFWDVGDICLDDPDEGLTLIRHEEAKTDQVRRFILDADRYFASGHEVTRRRKKDLSIIDDVSGETLWTDTHEIMVKRLREKTMLSEAS